jgi:hypothetical protein
MNISANNFSVFAITLLVPILKKEKKKVGNFPANLLKKKVPTLKIDDDLWDPFLFQLKMLHGQYKNLRNMNCDDQ